MDQDLIDALRAAGATVDQARRVLGAQGHIVDRMRSAGLTMEQARQVMEATAGTAERGPTSVEQSGFSPALMGGPPPPSPLPALRQGLSEGVSGARQALELLGKGQAPEATARAAAQREAYDVANPNPSLMQRVARGVGQQALPVGAGLAAGAGAAAVGPAGLLGALLAGGAGSLSASGLQFTPPGEEENYVRRTMTGTAAGLLGEGMLTPLTRGVNRRLLSRIAPESRPSPLGPGATVDDVGEAVVGTVGQRGRTVVRGGEEIQEPATGIYGEMLGRVDELFEGARSLPGTEAPLAGATAHAGRAGATYRLPGLTENVDEALTRSGFVADDPAVSGPRKLLGLVERDPTVGQAFAVRQALNRRARRTADESVSYAMRQMRQVLDDTISRTPPNEAIGAFRDANAASRYMNRIFEPRFLNDIAERKVTPEGLVDRLVAKRTSASELESLKDLLITHAPEEGQRTWEIIRSATIDYLDDAATARGQSDWSNRAFKTALDRIGPNKVDLLFPEIGYNEFAKAGTALQFRRMIDWIPVVGRGIDRATNAISAPSMNRLLAAQARQRTLDNIMFPGGTHPIATMTAPWATNR